jgi:hypothetical protein
MGVHCLQFYSQTSLVFVILTVRKFNVYTISYIHSVFCYVHTTRVKYLLFYLHTPRVYGIFLLQKMQFLHYIYMHQITYARKYYF